MRLNESAGRTFIRPTKPGELVVRATAGKLTAQTLISVKPSEPRPMVIWDNFTAPLNKEKGFESDWPLALDESARANESVIRIDLKDAQKSKNNLLLRLSNLPPREKLNREGIRGVFFDLKLSRDFKVEDPNARMEIIMQSEADWWMSLGEIKLDPAGLADWQRQQIMVRQEKHQRAMSQALNVWLILHTERPVSGAIYVDRAGLMVR